MRLSDFDVNENEPGWGDVIAAGAVLVMWMIVGFLWLVTVAAAR